MPSPPAGDYRAVLSADSGGTDFLGAETGEAAQRQRQKNLRAGDVYRQPACARHRSAAQYPHVHEFYEIGRGKVRFYSSVPRVKLGF